MGSSHPVPPVATAADPGRQRDAVQHPDAPGRPGQLIAEVRARMRRLGMSLRTEESYVGWIRRFILANGKRHPRDMGAPELEAFLTRYAGVPAGEATVVARLKAGELKVRSAAYRRSTQILLRGHVPLYRASGELVDA